MPDRSELARLILENNLLFEERDRPPSIVEREELERACAQLALRSQAIAELVRPALTGAAPRLLELGAGYLYLVSTMRASLGSEVELYTVEHPSLAQMTNERYAERLTQYGAELAACDLLRDEVPWAGTAFDAIVFADVIEHLPPTEVPALLARLRRRLTPSGRLVVSSPNLGAFCRIASLAFGTGRILDPPVPLDHTGETYGHLRLYGRDDVEELMAGAGLRVAEWRYLNYEHVLLERRSLAGRLVYAGQRAAPLLARRWSTSWVCAVVPLYPAS